MISPRRLYDALLVVGFGGPERPGDITAFLHNVTSGKNVPDTRLAEVARQYALVGGASPINRQTRALAAELAAALTGRGAAVPVYVGNRNWHPRLADTLATMAADGIERPLAVATSAFSSYSGCRQYLDDLDHAIAASGLGDTMVVTKVPPFWEVVGFLDALTELAETSLATLTGDQRTRCRLIFSAHSIPAAAEATSEYRDQLTAAAKMVAARIGLPHDLVFQSRSGPPEMRWSAPDIVDHIGTIEPGSVIAVVPIGFLSDHVEVLFDLDVKAAKAARDRDVTMIRVPTVGTHRTFVNGLADSLVARMAGEAPVTIGGAGGRPFPCAAGCCPPPRTAGST